MLLKKMKEKKLPVNGLGTFSKSNNESTNEISSPDNSGDEEKKKTVMIITISIKMKKVIVIALTIKLFRRTTDLRASTTFKMWDLSRKNNLLQ